MSGEEDGLTKRRAMDGSRNTLEEEKDGTPDTANMGKVSKEKAEGTKE